jgi:hypothetical protein
MLRGLLEHGRVSEPHHCGILDLGSRPNDICIVDGRLYVSHDNTAENEAHQNPFSTPVPRLQTCWDRLDPE